MTNYEFEEVRERGSPSSPTQTDVVLRYIDSLEGSKSAIVRFEIVDDVAHFDGIVWKKTRNEKEQKSSVSSDYLEEVVGIAIDVLHERDYEVESPFSHAQISGQLGENDE